MAIAKSCWLSVNGISLSGFCRLFRELPDAVNKFNYWCPVNKYSNE